MERSDFRFSRRDVRQYTGWSDPQIKRHLHKLEELEYLIVHRGERGQSYVYELYFERPADPRQLFLPGLSFQAYDAKRDGQKEEMDGPGMGRERAKSGGGAVAPESITTGLRNGYRRNPPKNTDTGHLESRIVAAGAR